MTDSYGSRLPRTNEQIQAEGQQRAERWFAFTDAVEEQGTGVIMTHAEQLRHQAGLIMRNSVRENGGPGIIATSRIRELEEQATAIEQQEAAEATYVSEFLPSTSET